MTCGEEHFEKLQAICTIGGVLFTFPPGMYWERKRAKASQRVCS